MSIINKFLPFFAVGFLFQSELASSFSSTSSNPRLMTATTTGTLLQSVDEKRVSGDEDDMSYHRRDVLMQAGASLFLMASAVSWNARPVAAVADCNKGCIKECNDVETWEKEELVKNDKRTESLTEDKPKVNITIVRTEVFKDPFKEAEKEMEEAEKAKNEEEVKKKKEQDAEAMWFSNMMDPMEKHENRGSTSIGKYLLLDEPKEKKKQQDKVDVTEEELEYATVPERKKVKRTSFDFSEIKF